MLLIPKYVQKAFCILSVIATQANVLEIGGANMVDTIILKKGPSVRYTALKGNNKLRGKGPNHD